jgi:tRNA U34 5-methylaminomethyl-2-thiouridine-forming methyltransferase MnmC
VKTTGDGSSTLYVPQWDEHYHSIHGAIQESQHVFIRNGLDAYTFSRGKNLIRILEIGMGTGLNVLLSMDYAKEKKLSIYYEAVEYYPLLKDEYQLLEYKKFKNYLNIHESPFDEIITLDETFVLKKKKIKIEEYLGENNFFDIIYYDAFAPSAQPELWTEEVFNAMYQCLCENGIFVTYCAKGEVKRRLRNVGFTVEALPGPLGKREMTKATKLML